MKSFEIGIWGAERMGLLRLKYSLLIVVVAFVISFIGFMLIEDLSPVDSAYLTMATLATVGYGDVHPVSAAGKVFAMFIMLIGVGAVYYTLVLVVSLVVEGHMKDLWGRRGMQKQIKDLRNHFIICGAGRVGANVIERMVHEKQRFVVIEKDPVICERLLEQKVLIIDGDATLDEIMLDAGIERARGVIAALSHDADNVYVTLTAKSLNPAVNIVARADRREAEEKLRRAGANTVIFPSVMGGRQMVTAMIQPAIMDFVENVFYNQELHLDIAEIKVKEESILVGDTLLGSGIKERYDAIIVAIKRERELLTNPKAETVICSGDILIVLGQRSHLSELNAIATACPMEE